ncbi:MAG: hypothetical protein ACPGXL_01970 [Chitinophagales bacterium]
MSPELYKELEQWSASEFRSLNGQIEYLLHTAVQHRKKGKQKTINTDNTNPSDTQD